jgi:hypothetical protein
MAGTWTSRVGALKKLQVAKLLALAEIAVLARDHVYRLDSTERRRLIQLVRAGRGRRSNLTAEERDELAQLIAKVEPRLFVGRAADKFSPVPLPEWMFKRRS